MSVDDERGEWRAVPPSADETTRMVVQEKTAVLTRLEHERHAAARAHRRRLFGGAGALVALVAVGAASGGVALGLIPSPFVGQAQPEPTSVVSQAPSPTPTASPAPVPTSTPSSPPVGGTPSPALDLGCDALGEQTAVTSLLRAPDGLDLLEQVYRPGEAAQRQAGVTTCWWTSSSDTGTATLNLSVSPDVDTGSARLAERRAAGAADPGVGDSSSLLCTPEYSLCEGGLVAGDFWVELQFTETPELGGDVTSLLTAHLQRVADVVGPATPAPAWVRPDAASRWTPTDSCSTLVTTTPMSVLLASPSVADAPIDLLPGSQDAIQETQSDAFGCRWAVPDGVTSPEGDLALVDVGIAPGARWAWEAAPGAFGDTAESATPTEVAGAEAATLRCSTAEGESCWLDVLVDDSWLQVGYSNDVPPERSDVLTVVAESLIAAR